MNKYRQYILAGVFGAMVLYYVGNMVVDQFIEGPLQAARQRGEQLQKSIDQREKELQRARSEAKLLARWESQSLPADAEVARSLYQGWLVELVEAAGLKNPSYAVSDPVGSRSAYQTIACTIRGRGTLAQLTEFLYIFYRTDLLHQVRSLSITPIQGSNELDLSVSIEAIILPGAGPEKLDQDSIFDEFRARAWRISDRLASSGLDAYRNPIVGRNLFSISSAPDPSDFAYLTAISSVNGQPEAWFTVRSTDEVLRLCEGDWLKIGAVEGVLVEIADSDVVIEIEGERWLLTLGESLAQASALPPEF